MATEMLSPSSLPLPSCPSCGFHLALPPVEQSQADLVEAQNRISDLEHQVRVLNEKATAAITKWADYEDELSRLRAKVNHSSSASISNGMVTRSSSNATASANAKENVAAEDKRPSTPVRSSSVTATPLTASPTARTILQSSTSRISSFLSPRKSTSHLRASSSFSSSSSAAQDPAASMNRPLPPTPQSSDQLSGPTPSPRHRQPYSPTFPPNSSSSTPTTATFGAVGASPGLETQHLIEQLTREQSLRKEAEGRLTETSKEVEELSVALFEQANEMVADERRARARLEERVGELERRDAEKRRRLERLEGAMGRIERVRNLLAGGTEGATTARGGDKETEGEKEEEEEKKVVSEEE